MRRNKYGGYNDVPNSRKRKDSVGYNPLLDNLYQTWYDMIKRCDKDWQSKNPTYLGTTVNDNWYYFSNFLKDSVNILNYNIYKSCNGVGMFLDKDSLVKCNKRYDLGLVQFITCEESAREVVLRTKSKRVKITNLNTGEVIIKNSSVEAGKFIGCSHSTISEYCRYSYEIYGYKVEYI